MNRMTVLTEAELRRIVTLDHAAVACVEEAFRALATLPVVMPPILRLDMPQHHGEVDVKTAYVPGLDGFAVKISSGFFDNPRLGLPSGNGMMLLLSARTGQVEALLLDNGYLTDVRTAAAGAVAAKHLSREGSSVAAILGAGLQARLQLEALTLVRPIGEARIWARDAARAEVAASDLREKLGIVVRVEAERERAIAGADIIVTTTPSIEPLVTSVEAGQHITAMGSDAEHKNEIAPRVLMRADLYVADSAKQTRRLGELHHAIAAGLMPLETEITELGQVIAGLRPARGSADAVTLADLTGTGVQDTAIAILARDRAQAAKAGTIIDN